MSAPNGHAPVQGQHINGAQRLTPVFSPSGQLNTDSIQEMVRELEVPFDPAVIEWRVTNTARNKTRGQVIPYADQRAYTDRLNALFTPAGLNRKYGSHKRKFRTQQRQESSGQNSGHMRVDHCWRRITFGHWRGAGR